MKKDNSILFNWFLLAGFVIAFPPAYLGVKLFDSTTCAQFLDEMFNFGSVE